ncbi:DUF4350 domain-containing protein [Gillisia sp. Q332]|uniref:DUF4350 domain-containing protein n=1 Tax=Gillisia xinjiangensis TaxID=3384765 RepID=UPI00391D761B
MSRGLKLAFGAFLLLVLFLTYLEATQPEPVNWNPSYLETDKIALGSFVLFDSWTKNKETPLEKVKIPPYEFLNEAPKGTYFFLNNTVAFDDSELKKVLNWVSQGNSVFISAGYIGKNLLDTLNMKATTYSGMENFISRPGLNFVHPKLKRDTAYKFTYDVESLYFSEIDTLNQMVLGIANYTDDASEEKKINFIKSQFGDGEIFLHSNPQALANYFLLSNDNYHYAEGVLAYINRDEKVYWDSYYKSGKAYASSPLYILLGNKALKWAYYLAIAGCILFIIFEGKRKQRAIPVVAPLKNQTYEYSKTIANLYLEQKEFKALAQKQIKHFYDYIRTRYRIDTSVESDHFYSELAIKSEHSQTETANLFEKFRELSNKIQLTKQELQDLNTMIQSYKNSNNE